MPTWPLLPDPVPQNDVGLGVVAPGQPQFLGFGIVRPFRRDQKNDFANDGGVALVVSNVKQILGTKCRNSRGGGEIPWRTELGSLIYQARHRQNAFVLQELARVYVVDALRMWETRAQVTSVKLTTLKRTLTLEIRFNVVDRNNAIIAPDQLVELPLLAA